MRATVTIRALTVVTERLAEERDVAGQAGVFDEAVRPHRLEQVLLPDDLAGAPDQDEQRLQDLRRQGDHLTASNQQRTFCRKPELVKRIACASVAGHLASRMDEESRTNGIVSVSEGLPRRTSLV